MLAKVFASEQIDLAGSYCGFELYATTSPLGISAPQTTTAGSAKEMPVRTRSAHAAFQSIAYMQLAALDLLYFELQVA